MIMFVPIHGHSTFSFLEAVGGPQAIISKAKELWLQAIGLTDLYGMYGIIPFYLEAQSQGIKPILGVELGFVLNSENVANPRNIGNIVLIAKDRAGYLNLLKLVSFANQEGIKHRPKVDLQQLKKYGEGLIILTGGTDSRFSKILYENNPLEKASEILDFLKEIVGADQVFLEVLAQDESQDQHIKKLNTATINLSQQSQTPCLVGNIYEYPNEKDKITQELAMAIKDNIKLFDPGRRQTKTLNHLMGAEEIKAICLANGYEEAQIQEWFAVSQHVADIANPDIMMGVSQFPDYDSDPEIIKFYHENPDSWIMEGEDE